MNPIKSRIIQFLVGEEYASYDDYMTIMTEVQEFIEIGTENEADAILYAFKNNKRVNVVGLVGKSIIQGPDLKGYLEAYFANEGGLEFHAKRVTEYLYNEIQRKDDAAMILKSDDERWRSFNPPKGVDVVLAMAERIKH